MVVSDGREVLRCAQNDMGDAQDDIGGVGRGTTGNGRRDDGDVVGDDGCVAGSRWWPGVRGELWRVEATPVVYSGVASVDSVSVVPSLCPAGAWRRFFWKLRFSSVFPGPCDKRTVWRQLPRQYGRP